MGVLQIDQELDTRFIHVTFLGLLPNFRTPYLKHTHFYYIIYFTLKIKILLKFTLLSVKLHVSFLDRGRENIPKTRE